MEAFANLHKVILHKETGVGTTLEWIQEQLRDRETACGGQPRNRVLSGCLLALASSQLCYKGIPSLRPGFHGGLFLCVLQGAVPAQEERLRSAQGRVGGQDREGEGLSDAHRTHSSPAWEQ